MGLFLISLLLTATTESNTVTENKRVKCINFEKIKAQNERLALLNKIKDSTFTLNEQMFVLNKELRENIELSDSLIIYINENKENLSKNLNNKK